MDSSSIMTSTELLLQQHSVQVCTGACCWGSAAAAAAMLHLRGMRGGGSTLSYQSVGRLPNSSVIGVYSGVKLIETESDCGLNECTLGTVCSLASCSMALALQWLCGYNA
jgi:hypothetical protein